jgi:hypothetical protein
MWDLLVAPRRRPRDVRRMASRPYSDSDTPRAEA